MYTELTNTQRTGARCRCSVTVGQTHVVMTEAQADLSHTHLLMSAEGFQSWESGKQNKGMTFKRSSASLDSRDDFSNCQQQIYLVIQWAPLLHSELENPYGA